MTNTYHSHDTLNSLFFNDLINIYPSSQRAYHCTSISDLDYAKLGVLRCISHAKTGQEFLQYHADKGQTDIDPGHFFKALKSARRLANITSLNSLLLPLMRGWGQSTRIHIYLNCLLGFRSSRMARQPRFQYPGALYHVMARGNGGEAVFVT